MSSAGFQGYSLLLDLNTAGAMLALLVCGHTLGDFGFQNEGMRPKQEARWLVKHSLEVMLLQWIFLVPFLSWSTTAVAVGLGLGHGLIDRLQRVLGRRSSGPLLYFWLDQLLHLASLLIAWWILKLVGWAPLHAFQPHLAAITTIAVILAAYAFNWNGAAAIVGAILQAYKLSSSAADDRELRRALRMGRLIGILERMLALTLVLIGQWGALGLIVAAKSIARFKDLEKRHFGEYYLIGTLASILIVILSGLAVHVLV